MLRLEDPTIVFMMDMKSDVDWMTMVHNQCGFKYNFIVPSDGLIGGLV